MCKLTRLILGMNNNCNTNNTTKQCCGDETYNHFLHHAHVQMCSGEQIFVIPNSLCNLILAICNLHEGTYIRVMLCFLDFESYMLSNFM